MYYGKNSYKNDIPVIKKAKENDREAFTWLFDKYFNIVLLHLYGRFNKVRREILQDIAIETIEYWFLNIKKLKLDEMGLGSFLCNIADQSVFKILRHKSRPVPFSDIEDNGDEDTKFIDYLIYKKEFSGYENDLAKTTFVLKKKADQFIGELTSIQYNVLTEYLNGSSIKRTAVVAGIKENNVKDTLYKAFKRLRYLIFEEKNSYFNQCKKKYNKSKGKVEFKNPEILKMFYEDNLNCRTISEVLGLDYYIVRNRLKRDRKRFN